MEINQIKNENCLTTMGEMDGGFLDLTVTSPPYDDLRDYEGYSFDFNNIAKELYRVTKDGGVVVWVVNDQTIKGSESGTSFRQALYFKEIGFFLHDTMIYEKNGCSMPSTNRYLPCFEFMFIFSKGSPKAYNLIKDRLNKYPERWGSGRSSRKKNGDLDYRGNYKTERYGRRFNIWRYNTGAGYSHENEIAHQHPATFPLKLATDHIISWSNEGDIIYDPFMGSGTTAIAAIRQNRSFIGSELSKKYVKLSEERIRVELSQGDFFRNDYAGTGSD
jgi:site-specific DNA-methyltransferase (adenine-specific)